ncbi:MAG TPA: TonB-dependent receptor [Opitutaceae bacterium]|nr:TonB-dependent receptor [Opitutaceae bacterium]
MKIASSNRARRNHGVPVKIVRAAAAFFFVALAASLPAAAPGLPEKNLGDLSIEELMKESITSVSKKEQRRGDAAAAVAVLSNDDLHRSGVTSFAEALRLVPGLNVATVDAGQWAISARGFSGLYAAKLLVLVDGRAVYSPIFSGVFWDLQQLNLEDLDRIEVIRGPGATVWGANAVNGVINAVSKSARDTQGTLLQVAGGDVHRATAGVRYGGKLDDKTFFRVEAGYQQIDDFPTANGSPAGDRWQSEQFGFRLDRYPGADTHLTWQAGTVINQLAHDTADASNINTIGRWTRELSERSSVEVQAYYDRTSRSNPLSLEGTVDTIDLSAQHTFGAGAGHDVIWGVGYRWTGMEQTSLNFAFGAPPGRLYEQLFSVFLQDEFKPIPDKLTLTAGAKVEHNDTTGFEFQPSIRAAFNPTERQTVWAAVSRAVRTPSVVEDNPGMTAAAGAPFPGPGGRLFLPELVGNPAIKSEVLWAYETGYRVQVTKRVNVDVAIFYNVYDQVIGLNGAIPPTLVPGVPLGAALVPWTNSHSGHTSGGEASLTISPVDNWRVTLGYSLIRTAIPGNRFLTAAPDQQVILRSSYDFSRQVSLDTQLRYVDSLIGDPTLGPLFPDTPAYTAVDVRFAYRPTARCELSFVVQNLFARQHPEPTPHSLGANTSEAPRTLQAKVAWHF